jgi:hypothetical protein
MTIPKKTFTTNAGRASYAYITKPDTKYNAEGVWKTDLVIPTDEAKSLLDDIKTVAADEFGPNAKVAWPYQTDADTNEVTFKLKTYYKPKVVDASGKLLAESDIPNIYGGSTIRAQGSIKPYNMNGKKGISLTLGAVQIIELNSGQGGADFDAVEGGWTASANDNQEGEASYNF